MPKYREKVKQKKQARDIVRLYQIALSDEDRITVCYKYKKTSRNIQREIIEVVNTSYDHYYNGDWITLVRLDNHHGHLHEHLRVSLQNEHETVTTAHTPKKGTSHELLTWANAHLRKNYMSYRRGFYKRSKLKDYF